jgi:hypothetical protein
MIWIVSVVSLILFMIMGRTIYMLIRARENLFEWEEAVTRAIYKAGWIDDYRSACNAAGQDLVAIRQKSRLKNKEK